MMLVVVSLAVALVAFIIYALERKSKSEPIVWFDALKLSLFGGLTSAGIVFATTAEPVKEIIKESAPAVQEMFVGSPAF
jgi:uncharacterized membrane protein AbrB (regulator of aidB expression)